MLRLNLLRQRIAQLLGRDPKPFPYHRRVLVVANEKYKIELHSSLKRRLSR